MAPWATPHSTGLATNLVTSFMLIKVFGVFSMFLKLSTLPPPGCVGGGGGGGGRGILFSS